MDVGGQAKRAVSKGGMRATGNKTDCVENERHLEMVGRLQRRCIWQSRYRPTGRTITFGRSLTTGFGWSELGPFLGFAACGQAASLALSFMASVSPASAQTLCQQLNSLRLPEATVTLAESVRAGPYQPPDAAA